jgi:hypothetical protein
MRSRSVAPDHFVHAIIDPDHVRQRSPDPAGDSLVEI